MKTKQVFFGLCLLLCSALFVSCEKEPVTDIGVIEKELKDVIRENNITTCDVILTSETGTYAAHKNASFEIKGGFLIVEHNRYNLLYLSKYDIYETITFYFADTKYFGW